MIKPLLATVVGLVIGCATAKPVSVDLERALIGLHEQVWPAVTPRIAQEILHKPMVLIDDSSPGCSGDVYFSDTTQEADRHVWLRFTKRERRDGCIQELSSVSLWWDFPTMAAAEHTRQALIKNIHAGGEPLTSGTRLDYVWRSNDSDFLFNLFTSITTNGDHSRLSVRLIHTQATPSTIDTLPRPTHL